MRATECGEEAWSVNHELMNKNRIYATSPWSQELRGFWPTRPAWQRLLCGSCSSARDLRSTLPPHTRSPSCSCASLHSLWPAC